MNIHQIERVSSVGVIVILGILLMFKTCGKDNLDQQVTNYQLLNDNLNKQRLKNGELEVSIGVFQGKNTNLLTDLKTKDASVLKLQEEVVKYKDKLKEQGSSATVIGSTTSFTGATETTVIFNEPLKDSCKYYPTYKAKSKDSTWIKYAIVATKDSTTLDLKVTNKYSVIIGSEKVSLFKRKPIAFVKSENPYTDIDYMRAFEVKDNSKKKRIGISIQAGYGLTIFGPTPYIGAGLDFNIVRIW